MVVVRVTCTELEVTPVVVGKVRCPIAASSIGAKVDTSVHGIISLERTCRFTIAVIIPIVIALIFEDLLAHFECLVVIRRTVSSRGRWWVCPDSSDCKMIGVRIASTEFQVTSIVISKVSCPFATFSAGTKVDASIGSAIGVEGTRRFAVVIVVAVVIALVLKDLVSYLISLVIICRTIHTGRA